MSASGRGGDGVTSGLCGMASMSTVTLGVPLVGTLASCLAFGATVSSLFVAGLGLVVAGVLVSALAVRPGRA